MPSLVWCDFDVLECLAISLFRLQNPILSVKNLANVRGSLEPIFPCAKIVPSNVSSLVLPWKHFRGNKIFFPVSKKRFLPEFRNIFCFPASISACLGNIVSPLAHTNLLRFSQNASSFSYFRVTLQGRNVSLFVKGLTPKIKKIFLILLCFRIILDLRAVKSTSI